MKRLELNIRKLTENITDKNSFGICKINRKKYFYKTFHHSEDYQNEIDCYDVIDGKIKAPRRFFLLENEKTIIYELIKNINRKNLHHYLYTSLKKPNIRFLDYMQVLPIKREEHLCKNTKFFRQRVAIIDSYLKGIDLLNRKIFVGGNEFDLRKILKETKQKIIEEKLLTTILSQGDPIDLNLLNDGTVVDFETAGENSLIGEIAIFINNILINGYYFFIKYAKSDYKNYLKDYKKNKKNLKCRYEMSSDIVNINFEVFVPKKNRFLINDYIDYFQSRLSVDEKREIDNYIKYYLIFRFISPKNWFEFSEEDLISTFALICITYKNISSIDDVKNFINK